MATFILQVGFHKDWPNDSGSRSFLERDTLKLDLQFRDTLVHYFDP